VVTKTKSSLYDKIVDITYDYLGPAAPRFITRGIETHLAKKPEKLTKSDIPILLDWSKLAIALLTDDKQIVDDFSERLLVMAKQHDS
jgi:hypothetical protein